MYIFLEYFLPNFEESSNKYIVAKFIGENENINKNACQSLKLVDNNINIRYIKECKKDNFGPNYNYIVTMSVNKEEVKNKIPTGAVASYVIGGVIGVIILMLSIYYISLNVKYKKCSKNDENSFDEDQI